jgi:hypothetical protein
LKRRFFGRYMRGPQPGTEQELPLALGKMRLTDYENYEDEKTLMPTNYSARVFGTPIIFLVRRESSDFV